MELRLLNSPTSASPLLAKPPAAPLLEGGAGVAKNESGSESANTLTGQDRMSEPVRAEQLDAALEKINTRLAAKDLEARYSVDEATGRFVVKVLDRKDQETVWQFPSEKALALAAAHPDELGALLDALV